LHARVRSLQTALDKERRRGARALDRLERQVRDAEQAAKVDAGRVRAVLGSLEDLADGLRAALDPDGAEEDHDGGGHDLAARPEPRDGGTDEGGLMPRGVPPAGPGRPCRLPDGVAPGSPAAVEALLRTPGVQVVVDGYNVSMSAAGRPLVALPEQRLWLLQTAGAVHARFRCRVTLVFDGDEPTTAPAPARRGVRLVFTAGEEIADDRIVDIVEELPAGQPVLVVSSDQEVQQRSRALGADVAPAAAFLAVVG
jgi:predicted RNA-binding protein with PIN domain